MRLGLFIDGTFIPERDGASARFARMPEHLVQQGVEVTVFHCYRGWSDLDTIASQPFQTYFFPPTVFHQDLDELCRVAEKSSLDIVQMNDAETILRVGCPLAKALGVRLVFEAHYHTSTLASQLGASTDDMERLRGYEDVVCRQVDHLIAFTEADKRRWVDLSACQPNRVSVVPFGVDDIATVDSATRDGIAFLGNLFYEPNRRAVERLALHIMPSIRASRPGTPAFIIGDIPAELRRLCYETGLQPIGEVPNPSHWLKSAAVGIAPVFEGSGIRAKILSYLAAGLPVVATSIASEGIGLPGILIADDIDQTVLACLDVLNRPKSYRAQVKDAQESLHRGRRWSDAAAAAVAVYSAVMCRPPRAVDQATHLDVEQPMWIQEVMKKGRFATENANRLGDYRFGVAGHGSITTYS
jgi:glycosyltransferase involved in cell wall biosynthesis